MVNSTWGPPSALSALALEQLQALPAPAPSQGYSSNRRLVIAHDGQTFTLQDTNGQIVHRLPSWVKQAFFNSDGTFLMMSSVDTLYIFGVD
jgi:hypothetical protein